MQKDNNKIFEDMAKMAGGAMGAVNTMRAEFEKIAHAQFEAFMKKFDFVKREEFETVSMLAKKAIEEQLLMNVRLAKLEEEMASMLEDRAVGIARSTGPDAGPSISKGEE